jgi:hypothetical protein
MLNVLFISSIMHTASDSGLVEETTCHCDFGYEDTNCSNNKLTATVGLVAPLVHIWEAPGPQSWPGDRLSSLSSFRVFPQSLQENSGIVPQIRQRSLHSTCYQFITH